MKTGMLFYYGDAPLYSAITAAAEKFKAKYGRYPDLIYANEKQVKPLWIGRMLTGWLREKGVRLETKNTVMPNHLWLGVAQAQIPEATA